MIYLLENFNFSKSVKQQSCALPSCEHTAGLGFESCPGIQEGTLCQEKH